MKRAEAEVRIEASVEQLVRKLRRRPTEEEILKEVLRRRVCRNSGRARATDRSDVVSGAERPTASVATG
jgi:hypothetical protein